MNQLFLLLLLLLTVASHEWATQHAAAMTHVADALLWKMKPTHVHTLGMRPGWVGRNSATLAPNSDSWILWLGFFFNWSESSWSSFYLSHLRLLLLPAASRLWESVVQKVAIPWWVPTGLEVGAPMQASHENIIFLRYLDLEMMGWGFSWPPEPTPRHSQAVSAQILALGLPLKELFTPMLFPKCCYETKWPKKFHLEGKKIEKKEVCSSECKHHMLATSWSLQVHHTERAL